jgi:hypothetical protein
MNKNFRIGRTSKAKTSLSQKHSRGKMATFLLYCKAGMSPYESICVCAIKSKTKKRSTVTFDIYICTLTWTILDKQEIWH